MTQYDLPSKYWAKHVIPNDTDIVAFSVCASSGGTLCFEKLLLCSSNASIFHCTAYVQGVLVKTVDVDSISDVKYLLFEMDAMIPCEGFEMETEMQSAQIKTKHRLHGGKLHSLTCCGTVRNRRRCLQCKYLRKLLINQAYYKRTKARQARANLTQKLTQKNAQLRRQKRSIAKLSETIEKMKQDNEAISSSSFKEKLHSQPKKQQVQVRECFEASKKKQTNGMLFQQEWILEWIVMHMKSPHLNEHIRKLKIMVVPSPSCLRTYVRKYKSGFGFNKVLTAIAEKARTIDPYH